MWLFRENFYLQMLLEQFNPTVNTAERSGQKCCQWKSRKEILQKEFGKSLDHNHIL